jgi:hypothetical protein
MTAIKGTHIESDTADTGSNRKRRNASGLQIQTARYGFLTVKLRGRTTTPDKRRGRTLSCGARGA